MWTAAICCSYCKVYDDWYHPSNTNYLCFRLWYFFSWLFVSWKQEKKNYQLCKQVILNKRTVFTYKCISFVESIIIGRKFCFENILIRSMMQPLYIPCTSQSIIMTITKNIFLLNQHQRNLYYFSSVLRSINFNR